MGDLARDELKRYGRHEPALSDTDSASRLSIQIGKSF
jgi:hypothetical protein